MKEKNKPRVPDLMEALFDVVYLSFDLIVGIIFLLGAHGRTLFILYGILTLTLCGGDAFHLVPRVARVFKGNSEKVRHQMCFGLQVSSVTMTIFYILLLYIWEYTFPTLKAPLFLVILIWASALIRIVICLLPQNNWYSEEGNPKLSILRNYIFILTGLGIIALYVISGNTNDYHMTRMVAAIIISFACYMPVVRLNKKIPAIGMLMIPKTCAYVWMIVMGLQLM